MDLSKKLFVKYFSNMITQDELYKKIGIEDSEFVSVLLTAMQNAYEQEDADMIEYLIFTIYLGKDAISISLFLDILNRLILCKWHVNHEDITLLLQRINAPESIEYLYKAIFLKPDYLAWDDNLAFEKKCIHAIAKNKNQEAADKLRMLTTNENENVKLCAKKQLQKVQGSI